MGRSKVKSKKPSRTEVVSKAAPAVVMPTPGELLLQSAHLIATSEYEQAKSVCAVAYEGALKLKDGKLCTDALEILGTIELELGELDEARKHFLESIKYAAEVEDPSPAPHLYLAQLSSPEESLTHFGNALTILQAKLAVIEQAKLGLDGGAGSEEEQDEENDLRRSASRALVGMTELYLTDLCFEADAEQKCEEHLALAATIDPRDPEVYQTLASVRLSQERPEDAKEAALKGWSIWRELGPESEEYPPAPARLTLAKLLLELSLHRDALEILQRLEQEDDEDPEMWYLSGWAWWTLGESLPADAASSEEEENRDECWSESKLCLENYLRLDEREPENSDPEQLAHVKELMAKLDAAGVVASAGQEPEGDGEWEDESVDDDEDDEAMEE